MSISSSPFFGKQIPVGFGASNSLSSPNPPAGTSPASTQEDTFSIASPASPPKMGTSKKRQDKTPPKFGGFGGKPLKKNWLEQFVEWFTGLFKFKNDGSHTNKRQSSSSHRSNNAQPTEKGAKPKRSNKLKKAFIAIGLIAGGLIFHKELGQLGRGALSFVPDVVKTPVQRAGSWFGGFVPDVVKTGFNMAGGLVGHAATWSRGTAFSIGGAGLNGISALFRALPGRGFFTNLMSPFSRLLRRNP
jgi:hypothetical protein